MELGQPRGHLPEQVPSFNFLRSCLIVVMDYFMQQVSAVSILHHDTAQSHQYHRDLLPKQWSTPCLQPILMDQQLTEGELEEVYNWVDEVPLSRPKRNMARDFSDAQLLAEIIEHFNPKIIELHNYVATGALPVKISNWKTLNRKVLPKIKLSLRSEEVESLANATPGFIQRLILRLKRAIEKGEIASPSTVSKLSKSNTSMPLGAGKYKRPKPYHKLPYTEIKKHKEVGRVVGGKEEEIGLLKDELGLLVLKAGKLEEILKGKDREIEELVSMIKSKN